jgi:copper(I)-binding protein
MINRASRRPRDVSLSAFLCALALCHSASAAPVFAVGQPWVAPTAGKKNTEAYMDLTSSEAVVLVAARSDAAAKVTLRAPPGIKPAPRELTLPAHVTIVLAPHAYRLAMTGIAAPLKRGDRVALTLTIRHESGVMQDIPVNAEVRLRSPIDDERRAHAHKH